MSFETKLVNLLTSQIEKYLQAIAEKYELELDDLKDVWESVSSTDKDVKDESDDDVPVRKGKSSLADSILDKAKSKTPKKNSEENHGKCRYVYVKNPRKGEQCENDAKENGMCTAHKKYADKEPKGKPAKTLPSLSTKSAKGSSAKGSSAKEPELKDSSRLLVKHINIPGILYHKESGLAFDSTTKKVIGKIVKNEMKKLKAEDLATAKQYSFMVDEKIKKQLGDVDDDESVKSDGEIEELKSDTEDLEEDDKPSKGSKSKSSATKSSKPDKEAKSSTAKVSKDDKPKKATLNKSGLRSVSFGVEDSEDEDDKPKGKGKTKDKGKISLDSEEEFPDSEPEQAQKVQKKVKKALGVDDEDDE